MDEASDGEQLEDSLISAEKAAQSKRGTRSEREDQLKKLLDDDDDGKAHPPTILSLLNYSRKKNDQIIIKKMTKKKPTTPPPPETKTPLPSHLPAKPTNQKIRLLLRRVAADDEEDARS